MKNIKRFSAVIGAAALLAFAFTSCDTFAGTEVNYGEKEKAKTGATGVLENLSSASIGLISVNGVSNGSIVKASEQTTIKFTITNNATGTRIDLSSVEKAVSFWSLKSNDNADFYKLHDAELATKVHSKNEEGSTSASTATIEFEVDTSAVTTNQIAMIVDAGKLKDKKGKLILNLDYNNKRGEESDSYIKYITVAAQKDGSAPDSLTGIDEDFRPEWNPNIVGGQIKSVEGWSPVSSGSIVALKDDDSKFTGEYEVRIYASQYAQNKYDDTPDYNKELAAELNKAFSLRVKEAASSSTSTKSLSFAWDEDNNRYKASAGTFKPGTKLDLISKQQSSLSNIAPAWYVDKYGHPAFTAARGNGAKGKMAGTTANVYVESPDYIVEGYSATEVEWDATTSEFDKTAIQAAQKQFLIASSFNGRFCTVTLVGLPGDIEITGKDFIIVDAYDSVEYKLPFKMTEKLYDGNENEDKAGKLKEIEFEITNKNISLHQPHLYVGSGVSLVENKRNASQKKFGQYKDTADGIHSGYVALN